MSIDKSCKICHKMPRLYIAKTCALCYNAFIAFDIMADFAA